FALAPLREWDLDPSAVIPLLLAAGLYGRGVGTIRRRRAGPPVPAGRQAAFYGGLGVVAVALLSPVGAYDDRYFSVHMVQHVLLTMAAAPLLLLGAPLTVAQRAVPRFARPVVRSRVLGALTHPLLTWSAF